jgi:hypothetical protein
MKSIGLFAIALSVTLYGCNGQAGKTEEDITASNIPQTNIKVDKQYDKDGNLLKYDSTYSYYYSNVKSDINLRDSILNNFKNQFNKRYFFSEDPFFNDLFFEDSLLMYDFYKKDFFLNRFRNNMNRMDSLFRDMDSLKNNFFNKQFTVPGPLKAPVK